MSTVSSYTISMTRYTLKGIKKIQSPGSTQNNVRCQVHIGEDVGFHPVEHAVSMTTSTLRGFYVYPKTEMDEAMIGYFTNGPGDTTSTITSLLNVKFTDDNIWATLSSIKTIVPAGDILHVPASISTITNYSADVQTSTITANRMFSNKYTTTSDKRLKTNISDVENALSIIKELYPVYYSLKTQPTDIELGFLAQDVEEVLPCVVQTRPDMMLGVSYDRLTALIIAAMKEQDKHIDDLRTRVCILEDWMMSKIH